MDLVSRFQVMDITNAPRRGQGGGKGVEGKKNYRPWPSKRGRGGRGRGGGGNGANGVNGGGGGTGVTGVHGVTGGGGGGTGGDFGGAPAGATGGDSKENGAGGDAPAPKPKRRQHRGSGGSRRNKQLQHQHQHTAGQYRPYAQYAGGPSFGYDPSMAVPEYGAAPQYYHAAAQQQQQWYAAAPWDQQQQRGRQPEARGGSFDIALTPHHTPQPSRSPRGERPPNSCCPTPNSDAKLRRNLAEIYNSVDVVLMNHAFESAGPGL